jgi:tetratricopeptide (TPR) repeat protein
MKAPKQTKQKAEASFERGNTHYEKKEYDLAIKEFTEAIRLDPNFVLAYCTRGNSYFRKEEYDLTIKDLTEAIRLDPTNTSAYTTRGIAYAFKNENDLGIRDFSEAIRLDPTNASAYDSRGGMYGCEKKYDLAIKDYTEAIRLDPSHAWYYFSLGEIYRVKKEYDLAIKYYTESIRLASTDDRDFWNCWGARTYYNRGEIFYCKKEYDLALKDYTEAVRLNPDIFSPYVNREKCSFCKLPHEFTHGSIAIGNDKFICSKCINKAEIMEKIKLDNDALYHQIIDDYQRYLAFHKEIDSMDESINNAKWLTSLTIDELRTKAREYVKPRPPEAIIINNIPIHKNFGKELLEGEIFKKHSEKDVEVSNLGRIKHGDCILEQYDPQNNGYLFVDIKSMEKTVSEKVYRLVAETWLEKPDYKEPLKDIKSFRYNTVHHISNNGYDNRMENLMWVTEWQHAMIHPWISIDGFDYGELSDLFNSYAEINITPTDYQRIINITKRKRQLYKAKSELPGRDQEFYIHMNKYINDWCNSIIDAMEDLIKKNEEGKKDSL